MAYILFSLLCGFMMGWLMRVMASGRIRVAMHRALMPTVYLLLCVIGIKMGLLPHFAENVLHLGGASLTLALGGMFGSVLMVQPLRWWGRNRLSIREVEPQGRASYDWRANIRSALFILAIITTSTLVGMVVAQSGLQKLHAALTLVTQGKLAMYIVCVILLLAGAELGGKQGLWLVFRRSPFAMLAVPLLAVCGTLLGSALLSAFTSSLSMREAMGVGCGFGFYSLASVVAGKIAGPTLGVVALLVSFLREILTMILAPWMARLFGPLAPIASGGATSADSTLPVILLCCGQDYACIAVISGVIISVAVAPLISLLL